MIPQYRGPGNCCCELFQMDKCACGLFWRILIFHWNEWVTFNALVICCIAFVTKEHFLWTSLCIPTSFVIVSLSQTDPFCVCICCHFCTQVYEYKHFRNSTVAVYLPTAKLLPQHSCWLIDSVFLQSLILENNRQLSSN